MKYLGTLLVIGVVVIIGAGGFIYSGWYQVGADAPHTMPVYWVLETVRERSIERAARSIKVPELDDSQLIAAGGLVYNEMCAGCHLEPGATESDLSVGLYPSPPDFSSHTTVNGEEHGGLEAATRRQFWIIKHGIKASGMPAWGLTHDDPSIWAIVAFMQKLPGLSQTQYRILTVRGGDGSVNAH